MRTLPADPPDPAVPPSAGSAAGSSPGRAVVVTRTGPLALLTDGGRPGLAHLGVPRCGALDPAALALANRLVGNPPDRAGLELLLGGLSLRAESPVTVAVTGPPVPVELRTAAGPRRPVGSHRAVHLAAGDGLEVGTVTAGLRLYLACSGGFAVAPELGSRGTDLLSGLGPAPVSEGDRLPLGPAVPGPGNGEPVPVSVPPELVEVPVLLGPRDDWFDEPGAALRATVWTAGSTSNRIGLRLSGEPLTRAADRAGRELPSEPVRPGAVQVPPTGRPVVFLADAPTTGGYPVVAVVADPVALAALAQVRPGQRLRLRPVR